MISSPATNGRVILTPALTQQAVPLIPGTSTVTHSSNIVYNTSQEDREGKVAQHYHQVTVKKLLTIMSEIGYSDRK